MHPLPTDQAHCGCALRFYDSGRCSSGRTRSPESSLAAERFSAAVLAAGEWPDAAPNSDQALSGHALLGTRYEVA